MGPIQAESRGRVFVADAGVLAQVHGRVKLARFDDRVDNRFGGMAGRPGMPHQRTVLRWLMAPDRLGALRAGHEEAHDAFSVLSECVGGVALSEPA